jgi:predicted ribosomally synthesized peptide with SipW-like signal peptide
MNTKTPVKILICLILIGVIGFGSMTYSAFSDTETSEGNTITVSTDYQSPPGYETATLMMENIDDGVPHPELPLLFNLSDDIGGNFTYNTAGTEFEYDFGATVRSPNTEYVLVTFQLKANKPEHFDPNSGVDLNNGTSNATGILLLNGSVNFDHDLVNTTAFLVLSGNVNWAQDYPDHLYSIGLIQYEDTDVPD